MSEHPVDAAARGAHRGPPTPRRPSHWLTWGLRVVLLLPLWGVASAVESLAGTSRDLLRAVLLVAAALSLLVIVAGMWWGTGRPRLNSAEQGYLVAELRRDFGPGASRRLRRALWRGGPIPDELRPWAVPYLSLVETGPLLSLVPVALGVNGVLLSVTGSAPLTLVDALFLVLSVVFGCVMVGVVMLARRARRTIRRDITMRRPAGEDTP